MEEQSSSWGVGAGGSAVADALVATRCELLVREARELVLAAAWADVHDEDSLVARDGGGRVLPGTERARACGGDGTPRVAEFAVAELAVLLGVGHGSAVHLLRDALDVRERHPLWWAQITAVAHADPAAVADGSVAGVRVWQARRVAGMCHAAGLDREQARWVDAASTRYAASLPWGRFEALVAAKIIEADPAAAAARERAAAMRRFVATGQTNEHGLKTLIVQANAGDVICLVALLDRVARILAVQGDTDPVAVRRAKAVEIVANPYACVRLLEKHATPDQQTPQPDDQGDDQQHGDQQHGDSQTADRAGDSAGEAAAAGFAERSTDEPGGDAADAAGAPGQGVLDLFGDRRIDAREPTADPARTGASPAAAPARTSVAAALRGRAPAPTAPTAPTAPAAPAATAAPADLLGGVVVAEPEPACTSPPARLRPGDLHPAADDSDDPPGDRNDSCPACGGRGVPGAAGEDSASSRGWRGVDPERLLPAATVYVHLSQESFTRDAEGVARFEDGIGPTTIEAAVALLGHRRVTITPVIDLAGQAPVDGYEAPARLREAVRLARPASVFPYSGHTGRRLDLDHTTAYRPRAAGGPPGQTRMENLGPLGRYEHRVKTHARGWVLRQSAPGVYEWRTRHGHWFRVDHTGTHRLGKHPHQSGQRSERATEDANLAARIVRSRAVLVATGDSPLEAQFAHALAR